MKRCLFSLVLRNSIVLMLVMAVFIGLMPLMTTAAQVVISVDFEDGTLMGFIVQGTDAERERGAGVISVSTDVARSGTHSLLINDRRQNWNGPSFDIHPFIVADTTYTISFWVHAKSPDSSDFTLSTQTGSAELGTTRAWHNLASAKISVDDGWVELSAIHYYSADEMDKGFISVYVENSNADAEYYIDDFTVTAAEGGAWNPKTDLIQDVSRRAGTFEDFDFEFWTQRSGDGTMMLTGGGTFWLTWSGHNVLGRTGRRLGSVNPYTHYGDIIIDYAASMEITRGHVNYLCLYGWTQDPLVEWYVIEEHGQYKPGNSFVGEIIVDDAKYSVYTDTRVQQPSIEGTQTFLQIFSIRNEHRSEGIITLSDHFKAWDALGLNVSGNLYEVALCIEGFSGAGSGEVTRHILTIGGEVIGSADDYNPPDMPASTPTPPETPAVTETPTPTPVPDPTPTPDLTNDPNDDPSDNANDNGELSEGVAWLEIIIAIAGGIIIVGGVLYLTLSRKGVFKG